jgi:hypothetical protein
MEKPLTKDEKFICELLWGCIPTDVAFVRNSKLFQEKFLKLDELKKLFWEIK